MSDDLDIRSGGIVEVDPATLRAVAARLRAAAAELDEACDELCRARDAIARSSPTLAPLVEEAAGQAWRAQRTREDAAGLATALDDAAALYEFVELRIDRALAQLHGDTATVAAIDARLAALRARHLFIDLEATTVTAIWHSRWSKEALRQSYSAATPLGPLGQTAGMMTALAALGFTMMAPGARIVHGERLHGPAVPITLTPLRSGAATAPSSLQTIATRMPGGDSRIRVERYTMPDGTRQFAVYVGGTQGIGGDEPFDITSDVQLYSGERSPSFDATMAALAEAGAEPGDTVHAFGYSQGAMVANYLATDGTFETPTLVTFGSPIAADVAPDTLSVVVRHSDDPVALLSSGGLAGSTGSPGSLVAERTVDPAAGLHDVRLPAHAIEAYTETAAMLDGSDDARMTAVRDALAQLGQAASVDVTVYTAEEAR